MYDAAVVLGAGVSDIGVGRIRKGIEVIKSGLARFLVFVGDHDDSALAISMARASGLSSSQVYVDTNSKNTVDNAYFAKKILKKLEARRILLITSRFHMERALATFEWVLGDDFLIDPLPVDDAPSEEAVREEEFLKRLIPAMKALFVKGDAEGIKRAVDWLYETVLGVVR